MNKMTQMKRLLSYILCIVLIAAIALFTIGCNDNKTNDGGANTPQTTEKNASEEAPEGDSSTDTNTSETTDGNVSENESSDDSQSVQTVLGEGGKKFSFIVVDKDGKQTDFTISTDKKYVGEALLDVKLIEGEDGPYGLYVKKVNGITADYDVDGTYWAFYINDQYAMTGVDKTEIKSGETYSFKVSK